MAINTRLDLEKYINTYQYPNIFIKPINTQFAHHYGEIDSHNIVKLLFSLKVDRNSEKKWNVRKVVELMRSYPEVVGKHIQDITHYVPKQTQVKDKEDDSILDPFFDIKSVDKWYRPKNIKLTESQYHRLFEGVFINGIKGNKANLTYQKNQNYSKGNLVPLDNLKTDKMDMNNSDTYEVRLKGGLISYNITSIKGMEVMHYFKRLWDKEKTTIKIDNGNETKDYELTMLSNEFNAFKQQFLTKVNIVVEHAMQQFAQQGNNVHFEKVCVMPVVSHSHFNEKMCEEIANASLCNLPIQVISKDLLVKDISKMEKDEDFINKNKEFYDAPFSVDTNSPIFQKSTLSHLDSNLNKFHAIEELAPLIEQMNAVCKKILIQYYNYNHAQNNVNQNNTPLRLLQNMAQNYMVYFDLYQEIKKRGVYLDLTKGDNEYSHIQLDGIMQAIDYTKDASVEKRSNAIWQMVKPYLRGQNSQFTTRYYALPLNLWQKRKFQIKDLPNSIRMGLRNIYTVNNNEEFVKSELAKTYNSVFVVFDDNISGGATLADVCYQLQQLGIKYIVPITFGKMQVKNSYGVMRLNSPQNGYNY